MRLLPHRKVETVVVTHGDEHFNCDVIIKGQFSDGVVGVLAFQLSTRRRALEDLNKVSSFGDRK